MLSNVPSRQEIIDKLKIYEIMLVFLFATLVVGTTYLLWPIGDWGVIVQVAIIMAVGSIGEHYISGKGYYYYTDAKHNGFFIGRVPSWIPFMWVFVVQGAFIIPLFMGLSMPIAIIASGVLCFILDLVIVEPVLSRKRALWAWTPVENGYLGFLPSQIDRFTAPPGNYIVWFIFPVITNSLLYGLMLFFIG